MLVVTKSGNLTPDQASRVSELLTRPVPVAGIALIGTDPSSVGVRSGRGRSGLAVPGAGLIARACRGAGVARGRRAFRAELGAASRTGRRHRAGAGRAVGRRPGGAAFRSGRQGGRRGSGRFLRAHRGAAHDHGAPRRTARLLRVGRLRRQQLPRRRPGRSGLLPGASGPVRRGPVVTAPAGGPVPKVRVLWLTKGLGRGGAEQLLVNCARHVDTERFEVEVAYVLPWKDALVPALRAAGVTVHCLGDTGGSAADAEAAGHADRDAAAAAAAAGDGARVRHRAHAHAGPRGGRLGR
ncbi:hypothetical protein ACU686_04020 [Yinghuangia aomiensis]